MKEGMKLWIIYLDEGSIARKEINLEMFLSLELDNLRGSRIQIKYPGTGDRGFNIYALEGNITISPRASNAIRLDIGEM